MIKEFEGVPHIFIEYVGGPTLADILHSRPGKPLPVDQTTAVIRELLRGMKFLHGASLRKGECGVIHGNLTPRNVLTNADNIKITDPGLSDALRSRKGLAHLDFFSEETPYMAPEHLDGGEATKLSDIYSFGAILYEMATGTQPRRVYGGSDPMAGMERWGPIPPTMRNRACPSWLEGTILKCMATKPENRFQSFEQIEKLVQETAYEEKPAKEEEKKTQSSRVARIRGVAKKESSRLNHYYLGVEHLMLGLLAEEEGLVISSLDDQVDTDDLRSKILSSLPKGEGPWHWEGMLKTPRYKKVLKLARELRQTYADDRMLPHHILLAMIEEGSGIPVRVLRKLGIDTTMAIKKLRQEMSRRRPAILVTDPASAETQFVHKVACTTASPCYMPFIGRHAQLDRAREIILQDRNSLLIVGEPGVGKTAFAQQLACNLSDSSLNGGAKCGPAHKLRTTTLFASVKGEEKFIETLRDILDRMASSNSVLLIEDIPVLFSADVKVSPAAVVPIFEEYISQNRLITLATTTPDAYSRWESEHKNLARLFEVLNLAEPSREEATQMLGAAKTFFETEHSVTIDDGALTAALGVSPGSGRHRAIPARAFEVLEEACACARRETYFTRGPNVPVVVTIGNVEQAAAAMYETA
jgi:hypothetical protein